MWYNMRYREERGEGLKKGKSRRRLLIQVSLIIVPVFVLITAADQLYAQSLNLVFFVASSLAALAVNLIGGRIRWRVVASVALPGCVGAVGGAIIAHSLGSDVMRTLFGLMLIACGTISLLGGKRKGRGKKVKGEER